MRGLRERSYDLAGTTSMEDVAAALAPVGRLAAAPACSGVSSVVFYDTRRLALSRAGITLRRAEGAGGAGWQVDLPGDDPSGGAEYWLPRRVGTGMPDEISALVARHLDGAPLRPVARLRTARTSFELLGPGGEALARLAEDRVVALRARDGAASAWRELAVLGLRGGPGCDEGIGRGLAGVGASAAPHASKLARVLAGPAPGKKRRADPVAVRLGAQLDELLRCEPGVREGSPEAVHDMRVATRRLRSCCSAFAAAFEPGSLDELVDAVRALGRLLGTARDADVLAARLEADLAAVPALHVLGPVRAVIRAHGARESAAARRALVAFLDGPGHRALLDRLAAVAADPPLLRARRPRAWYRARLRRAERRVERLVAGAEEASGDERARTLHEVRKAVKHARYVAETVAPVLGEKASRRAKAYTRLQDVLGAHHDAVAARAFLREEGARAGVRPGENGFTYGLLFSREDARVHATEARFAKLWRRLAR